MQSVCEGHVETLFQGEQYRQSQDQEFEANDVLTMKTHWWTVHTHLKVNLSFSRLTENKNLYLWNFTYLYYTHILQRIHLQSSEELPIHWTAWRQSEADTRNHIRTLPVFLWSTNRKPSQFSHQSRQTHLNHYHLHLPLWISLHARRAGSGLYVECWLPPYAALLGPLSL